MPAPDVTPRLDSIDLAILAALQADARLSNKELAAAVGLAPSSCLERVKRLRTTGVLRGFHADVEPEALGIRLQAITAVRLKQHQSEDFSSFAERVFALAEVVSVFQLAGADDFLIHVAVRDPEHLRELVVERIGGQPQVAHIETSLIFRHAHKTALPQLRE